MDGRCVITMLTLAFLAPQFCAAQVGQMPHPPEESSRSVQPLLVLVDGRVLSGRYTPRPDGYDVEVTGGRMFVSSNRVRFTATDLQDAYQRMRSSQSELTPQIHVELARWCLRNELWDEAHREVLDALHLDPNREDAKRMLAALVGKSGSTDGSQFGSGLTEFPSTRQSEGTPFETRSLAGFSRPVAQEFTRHVQPLMMNKCANSGCHGVGAESSFQLASAHRGSSPTIAERNLAAVLKQIDLSRPDSSPLLTEVEGTHGPLNTPLFRGRIGAQQLEILRNWVNAAADEIAPDAKRENETVEGDLQLASAIGVSRDPSLSQHQMNDNTVTPHGRRLSTADTDPGFLAEAARTNARDDFNPAVFNLKFHGRTGPGQSTASAGIPAEPEKSDALKESLQ